METSIVWFKTNLRVCDNEVLLRAIYESRQVICIYCFDELHFSTTNMGFKKTGAFRARFLLESLKDLDQSLRNLGAGLIILRGAPEHEILKTAVSFAAQKVYAQKEVAYEELQTQNKVEQALKHQQISFETIATQSLYREEDLPFGINKIPDVFTVFRKKVEANAAIAAPLQAPHSILSPPIKTMVLPDLKSLNLEAPQQDSRAVLKFKGGENAAWQRLQHYFFDTKKLSKYKFTRNEMVGADYSCKLSAWMALGCISARSIYAEVKKYEQHIEANESTYWLIFELLWRDYFIFNMQKYGSKCFAIKGIKSEKKNQHPMNLALFETWKNGNTGNDFVDANMLELKHTGFMSNRGRQNVASYLCHNLKLDWRYGAAYFEEQLIDYDVCSNYGNWIYIADVGNDPRPNRVFNIEKQAAQYDEDFKFRKLWLSKKQELDD